MRCVRWRHVRALSSSRGGARAPRCGARVTRWQSPTRTTRPAPVGLRANSCSTGCRSAAQSDAAAQSARREELLPALAVGSVQVQILRVNGRKSERRCECLKVYYQNYAKLELCSCFSISPDVTEITEPIYTCISRK